MKLRQLVLSSLAGLALTCSAWAQLLVITPGENDASISGPWADWSDSKNVQFKAFTFVANRPNHAYITVPPSLSDWTGAESLLIRIYRPDSEPSTIVVALNDPARSLLIGYFKVQANWKGWQDVEIRRDQIIKLSGTEGLSRVARINFYNQWGPKDSTHSGDLQPPTGGTWGIESITVIRK